MTSLVKKSLLKDIVFHMIEELNMVFLMDLKTGKMYTLPVYFYNDLIQMRNGSIEDRNINEELYAFLVKNDMVYGENKNICVKSIHPENISLFMNYILKHIVNNNINPKSAIYATWNITERCESKCIYCSNSNIDSSLSELTVEKKIELVDVLVKNDIKHIKLLGGEPTIAKNFVEILDYMLYRGVYVSISSNGQGVSEQVIDVLRKYSPHMYYISISLDSNDEILNDAQRGIGSYKIATRAIAMLSEIREMVFGVNSVVTPITASSIYSTYIYAKNNGVGIFNMTPVLRYGSAAKDDMILIPDEELRVNIRRIQYDAENSKYIKIGNIAFELNDKFSINNNKIISDDVSNILFRMKCNAGIVRMHIDSQGGVYPCDFLRFPEFYMGNLLSEQFDNVWNNSVLKKIRFMKREDKKECRKCNIKSCTTGCMGIAYCKYSSIYRKDPGCNLKCIH